MGKLTVYSGDEVGDTSKINCIYQLWNIYVSPSRLRAINHSFLLKSKGIEMLAMMSLYLETVMYLKD